MLYSFTLLKAGLVGWTRWAMAHPTINICHTLAASPSFAIAPREGGVGFEHHV